MHTTNSTASWCTVTEKKTSYMGAKIWDVVLVELKRVGIQRLTNQLQDRPCARPIFKNGCAPIQLLFQVP